jgi:hypothetical protein
LLKSGNDVTLITRVKDNESIPMHFTERLNKSILIKWKDWKLLKVNFLESSSWLNINKYKRLLNGFLYKFFDYPEIKTFFDFYKVLQEVNDDFDICLSIDGPQPMHWALIKARKKRYFKTKIWIADCGDPFTRAPFGNKVAFYFKYIENWFCKHADHITVPIKEGFCYFPQQFKSKITVIPHSLTFP